MEAERSKKKYFKGALGGWLIFFYSVPSKPVNNRVKIWRRLAKIGAIQLKGSVYMLPNNDANYEMFQWLANEVESMNGEAAFLISKKIETLQENEIIKLFNKQRAGDYWIIEKNIDKLENMVGSFKKGTRTHKKKKFNDQMLRIKRDFGDLKKIDFFLSKEGKIMEDRIKHIEGEIKNLSGLEMKKENWIGIKHGNLKDYQRKIWATRKRPFVDRIASAWLIKEFIDRKATFRFIDEHEIKTLGRDIVTFDISGGQFTHVGTMCTFEVLLKSFDIKDKSLRKIAEVVHELDLKDDKYSNPLSRGIEEVLIGIRKTEKDDAKILEKGMTVISMLYASMS